MGEVDNAHSSLPKLAGNHVMCAYLPDHGHASLRAKLTSMLSSDSFG
jgi:hypothetical protein